MNFRHNWYAHASTSILITIFKHVHYHWLYNLILYILPKMINESQKCERISKIMCLFEKVQKCEQLSKTFLFWNWPDVSRSFKNDSSCEDRVKQAGIGFAWRVSCVEWRIIRFVDRNLAPMLYFLFKEWKHNRIKRDMINPPYIFALQKLRYKFNDDTSKSFNNRMCQQLNVLQYLGNSIYYKYWVIQNIGYYKILDNEKYRILQNLGYYKISDDTKNRILQNVAWTILQTINYPKCSLDNTSNHKLSKM